MESKTAARAEAQMMIRRPASDVFEAFIEPEKTKYFWFTRGSGKLETGKTVTWEWEMYNISTTVTPREIIKNEKILYDWDEPAKTVEFSFRELSDGNTLVTVTEWGYTQTGDELLGVIRDSTGGFTTVLDGLKAFLEHGINLNLIRDKFPAEAGVHGN